MSPVVLLRNSEIQTFKKCEHRWQWTYRDGRQAREAPRALRFGDLIHQALAAYYIPGVRRGPHPAETFVRLYDEQAKALMDDGFNVWEDDKWVDALDLGERMMNGYVEHFRAADEEWEVISSEQTFKLRRRVGELPSVGTPDVLYVNAVGTFDGVWRNRSTGRLVFAEFKTAAAIKEDGLPLDEQAGTYWTYGPAWLQRRKLLRPGESISHIMYRFLRKAAPDPAAKYDAEGRKLNKDGSVSKQQPAPYFREVPVYRDQPDRERMDARIREEALRLWRAQSRPVGENIKNPGPLHMPNCLGCPVREACELHEAGGDWLATLNATTVRWDPYAAHELPERS